MNRALSNLKERGFISQCTDLEALSGAMDAGSLTFYLGCDPTGNSLHIGHMVPFFAFRHLIESGHKGIALIGGGTARIGDPSGKTETRKMLSRGEIDGNAAAIKARLERFLGNSGSVQFENNQNWLDGLNYIDFLRDIGRHFSVNRMLGFESYRKRMETGLSFIEFNYQLLQSYDFYQLYRRYGCTLQIGGDDQWGNIVAGIELIRRLRACDEGAGGQNGEDGQNAAGDDEDIVFGLTFPLITAAGGVKMGKTEKGALFLDPEKTSPYEFFQYWRNTDDRDILRFLLLFTFLPAEECRALCAPEKNPNEAKERLAWEVCNLIHGKDEADKALSGAKAAFGHGGERSEMPSRALKAEKLDAGYGVTELFFDAGLCPSKSEARRLVVQGGAAISKDGKFLPVKDAGAVIGRDFLNAEGELLLRAGKKKFCRIVFGGAV